MFLRELIENDLDDIYALKSNPEVVFYLTWGPSNKEQKLTSLKKQIAFQSEENRKIYVLAVGLKSTNKVIGNALLLIKDDDSETAEIGYFLHPDYWHTGYGKEVVEALLMIGFRTFELHRLFARCDVENAGSVNLLKKVGFRLEGHFLKDLKVKGDWRNNYLFALLKEEYSVRKHPKRA
ncbi:GNAT family N-acetyltransferase [Anaerobacillus sp. CMMVII]|nr:GNAT family N-acetyltransferase [Anaerobacillus sp. CMMVII]